jgi:hypothetical protein
MGAIVKLSNNILENQSAQVIQAVPSVKGNNNTLTRTPSTNQIIITLTFDGVGGCTVTMYDDNGTWLNTFSGIEPAEYPGECFYGSAIYTSPLVEELRNKYPRDWNNRLINIQRDFINLKSKHYSEIENLISRAGLSGGPEILKSGIKNLRTDCIPGTIIGYDSDGSPIFCEDSNECVPGTIIGVNPDGTFIFCDEDDSEDQCIPGTIIGYQNNQFVYCQ